MEKKNQGIQSVEQAFDIIEFFSDSTRPMSLGEAAKQMNLSKSKLHKYLASLLRVGVVAQDSNGNYHHGSKLVELGAKILGRTDIIRLCEPELQKLRLESQEAAALAVWTTNGPMIVRFLESPLPVAVNFKVGFYAPLTGSAVGACFAAFNAPQTYQHLLNTEAEGELELKDRFMNDLENIRACGYAVRRQENPIIPGAKAVSSPIFDALGEVVACIVLIGFDRKEEIRETDISLVLEASRRVSQQLGYANC